MENPMTEQVETSTVWRHLSKEHVSKETVVQVTFVQGDSCPRRLLSKETIVQGRLMSKETFVQGDICPRRQLHVFSSKDIFSQSSLLNNLSEGNVLWVPNFAGKLDSQNKIIQGVLECLFGLGLVWLFSAIWLSQPFQVGF